MVIFHSYVKLPEDNFTNRNWITSDFLRETGRSPTGPGRGLSCTSGSTGSDRLRKAMEKPWENGHINKWWLSWLLNISHDYHGHHHGYHGYTIKHQPFNMVISMVI